MGFRLILAVPQVGNGLVTEDDTMIALAISPDGRSIATGSSSGIVRQYYVATHERVGPDLRGHTFEVGGIAYSSDGSLLASTTVGLSTTRLWEAAAMAAIGVRAAGPQPEVAPNHACLGLRAAGPQPEVAPNHACLGSARVALIAGRGSVSTAARPGSPARPALGGRAPITSRLAR